MWPVPQALLEYAAFNKQANNIERVEVGMPCHYGIKYIVYYSQVFYTLLHINDFADLQKF